MKIEVLTTLKGNVGELFAKGTIFMSPDIPQTIMEELAEGSGKTVRILEEDQVISPEVKVQAPVYKAPIVTAPPVAPVVVTPSAPPVEPPPAQPTKAPVSSKKHPRMKR